MEDWGADYLPVTSRPLIFLFRNAPGLQIKHVMLGWRVCRAKFARKMFVSYEFSYEKCSEISPIFLSLYFVGEKNSRKIPAKCPAQFPFKASKTFYQRASAGAQGECNDFEKNGNA